VDPSADKEAYKIDRKALQVTFHQLSVNEWSLSKAKVPEPELRLSEEKNDGMEGDEQERLTMQTRMKNPRQKNSLNFLKIETEKKESQFGRAPRGEPESRLFGGGKGERIFNLGGSRRNW